MWGRCRPGPGSPPSAPGPPSARPPPASPRPPVPRSSANQRFATRPPACPGKLLQHITRCTYVVCVQFPGQGSPDSQACAAEPELLQAGRAALPAPAARPRPRPGQTQTGAGDTVTKQDTWGKQDTHTQQISDTHQIQSTFSGKHHFLCYSLCIAIYQGRPTRKHYTFQKRTRAGAINLLLLLHACQGGGIKYYGCSASDVGFRYI